MSEELLEVYLPTELVVESGESLVTKDEVPVTLHVNETETLLVDTPSIELLEIGIQGPPGPPGSGSGGTGFEKILDVDYSNSIYSYVGTASKISRIDYSTSPPLVLSYSVTNYSTDWLNRQILGYS